MSRARHKPSNADANSAMGALGALGRVLDAGEVSGTVSEEAVDQAFTAMEKATAIVTQDGGTAPVWHA